jgi:hypothetical protein
MTPPTPDPMLRATPSKARMVPAAESSAPEVTAAVRRAANALAGPWRPEFIEPGDLARVALTAALDVPQMASAIVDHLLTDTLSGDSETLVCGGCGHVLVTGDPDDDRNPQAEHATHHAALIRTALLGPDVVWQGDGVRAVASGVVAVDDEEESDE